MGGQQPVGDVNVPQGGQRVGAAWMETQKVFDIVLLPVVLHHERRHGLRHQGARGVLQGGPHATMATTTAAGCSDENLDDGRSGEKAETTRRRDGDGDNGAASTSNGRSNRFDGGWRNG